MGTVGRNPEDAQSIFGCTAFITAQVFSQSSGYHTGLPHQLPEQVPLLQTEGALGNPGSQHPSSANYLSAHLSSWLPTKEGRITYFQGCWTM